MKEDSNACLKACSTQCAMRMRQYSTGLGSLRAGSKTEVVPG